MRFYDFSFSTKKINAILGRRDDSDVTKWMLSNWYPRPVHSFTIFSISSSVTVLVSITLYAMAYYRACSCVTQEPCNGGPNNFPVAIHIRRQYNLACRPRKKSVLTGLDRIEALWPRDLKGARAGLVVHPASVDRKLRHAVAVCAASKKFKLSALFGPQHGILGQTQDNMIEWEGFRDPATNLPVYSLYGNTRKPLPGMLDAIDVLIIDLQDVGSRYYTFIWTLDLCMQACHEAGKTVVVLDRPNPINGLSTEGHGARSRIMRPSWACGPCPSATA